MILKISLFYISASILFILSDYQSVNFRGSPKSKIKYGQSQAFSRAVLTGDKSGLGRASKKNFKALNLMHIFTPSGIHYSVLRSSMVFISRFFIVNLIFALYFRFFTNLYSIQRIAFIHITKKLLDLESAFFLVFILEFLFGNWHSSALSFTYSYLFFGSIIISYKREKILLYTLLSFSIIFSKYFMDEPLYLLSLVFNFPLTILFTLMLPLFILGHFISIFDFFTTFYIKLCELVYELVEVFDPIAVGRVEVVILFTIFIFGIKKAGYKTRP